ncbi:hypothetical protein BV20DRAFT_1040161 [Pilatotrama ljubarskyi]|nr:hypothetical protein BV20DRAFT_1040161 [Pilatotrama ljubarskyi]
MPEHCQPSVPSIAVKVAIIAVDRTSSRICSSNDSLDKDLDAFIHELNLGPDSSTWVRTLAARLGCREKVFQHRAEAELVIHREALVTIFSSRDGQASDLMDALLSDVAQARSSFTRLENAWDTLNFLGDSYLLYLDVADREAFEAACPSLQRTYAKLHEDMSRVNRVVKQWDDCFRTVIAEAGFQECTERLRTRTADDINVYARDLLPLFECLRKLGQDRKAIGADCVKWRDSAVERLFLRHGDRIPTREARDELGKLEELERRLREQKCLQLDTMESIKRIVDDATLDSSTIRSATHARLSMERVHKAFHRYEEIRVTCAHVVDKCCSKTIGTMQRYVTLMQRVRDAL